MKKNWLIRTKEHEIIGPVSRDKVLSLLQENKLLDEDELCQGNSFWFYVKEKNFLKEYFDIEISSEDNNQQNDFVLESNSGDEKKLETEENVSNQSETIESPDVGKSNGDISESNNPQEEVKEGANKEEQPTETLGDKFKLPEGKKSAEIDSVKKSIQNEIEKEIRKDEIINSTKKNLIYPIIFLLLISGILYLFYYVKFLGGKIPFVSKANATTKVDVAEKKKILRVSTLIGFSTSFYQKNP